MIFATLCSHYRRHPMQAVFLFGGIVMANVLLVGTQLINAQARASYSRGEQLLGSSPTGRIVASDESRPLEERLFVELRRQGFDTLAPMLDVFLRTADGNGLKLLGVDALSMPRTKVSEIREPGTATAPGFASQGFDDFAFPPYSVLAASARLKQLGAADGTRLKLTDGTLLPPLRSVDSEALGHRMLIDLGILQELSQRRGQLSALLVFEQNADRLAALQRALPEHTVFIAAESTPDPGELTRSLHLNLAAMGLLACVVGLFLSYNAIAFSYTDRRELLRKLRLAGVSRHRLSSALLLELLLFLCLGSAVGLALGSWLAMLLLPGLGLTLAQLYDVYISYPDGFLPTAYAAPLLISMVGVLLCAGFPLRRALHAPMLDRRAESWHLHAAAKRDRYLLLFGILLMLTAATTGALAASISVALLGMACLLLGAALCLPALLRGVLTQLTRRMPPSAVRRSWLAADSRWLLGPASVALMAVTLALVANHGLNTMIDSFRGATDTWLEQRLAAQLYLRDEKFTLQEYDKRLRSWLQEIHPALALVQRYRVQIDSKNPRGEISRIEIIDLPPRAPFLSSVSFLQAVPDAQARFAAGQGIYISERAWRLDAWQLGDNISLCDTQPPSEVLGIYYDYGNPYTQFMMPPNSLNACWPMLQPEGIAITGPNSLDWPSLRAEITREFELKDNSIVNQGELRAVGMQVFDRTFVLTKALNMLTLLVAGIGIFCSISAIHHHRVGQQALLASLGLSRRDRGWMLLSQWGLLGVLCTLLVWPFGTALAWYLAAVVTPVAFGWSFPLRLEAAPYLSLALLSTLALILAVLLPSLRLLRVSPAAMLREQSV